MEELIFLKLVPKMVPLLSKENQDGSTFRCPIYAHSCSTSQDRLLDHVVLRSASNAKEILQKMSTALVLKKA